MTAVANVTILDPDRSPDRVWAEDEFAAIASGLGNAAHHVRILVENWEHGREVSRFYPVGSTVASVFMERYPEAFSSRNVRYLVQSHRIRLLLGADNFSAPDRDEVADYVLREFGDPTYIDPEKARAWFQKARDLVSAAVEAGTRTDRRITSADIRKAMGVSHRTSAGLDYWHGVLDGLTTNRANLTATMAARVAATAVYALVALRDLGDTPDESEMESLRRQLARL